jgi:hypothetical protein
MTKTVFYKKVGRRYIPVSEYDSDLSYALPKGTHMISVYPGGSSTRYHVDPALGPLIAAGRFAEEAISNVIYQATEMRPAATEITPSQRTAFNAFLETMPRHSQDRYLVTYGSCREATEAGVKAMQAEADKLLTNPAVRTSWEHFMTLCKLTMEQKNGS